MMKKRECAIYKGDSLLAMGTIEECAATLHLSRRYIFWLMTPSAKKRLATRENPDTCMVGIRLDDE